MRALEKNIKGFSFLEIIVVIAMISIISAVAYPNFNNWRKERVIRSAAIKIKSSINNINSQLQKGSYAFVQVDVMQAGDVVLIDTKGMRSSTLTQIVRAANESDAAVKWTNDFNTRCADDQDWDDIGMASDKLEVSFLELDVSTNFINDKGTICFSRDGTYYSTSGQFNLAGTDTSVNTFYICGRTPKINVCDVDDTDGPSDLHLEEKDSVFAITWTRFGTATLAKWSKNKYEKSKEIKDADEDAEDPSGWVEQ